MASFDGGKPDYHQRDETNLEESSMKQEEYLSEKIYMYIASPVDVPFDTSDINIIDSTKSALEMGAQLFENQLKNLGEFTNALSYDMEYDITTDITEFKNNSRGISNSIEQTSIHLSHIYEWQRNLSRYHTILLNLNDAQGDYKLKAASNGACSSDVHQKVPTKMRKQLHEKWEQQLNEIFLIQYKLHTGQIPSTSILNSIFANTNYAAPVTSNHCQSHAYVRGSLPDMQETVQSNKHSKKIYNCSLKCGVRGHSFNSTENLRNHMAFKHCVKKYKCDTCNKIFANNIRLKRHIKSCKK